MKRIILAVAICAITAPAWASDWTNILKAQPSFGCTVDSTPVGVVTRVNVTCDRQKVIEAMPMLQRIGLMNPDLTQTQLNAMPNTVATGFLLQDVGAMINPMYRGTSAQETAWDAALTVPDDYGHLQRKTVFSFHFTRALNNRIDWNNFEIANLAKVAPHFWFSPWGQRQIGGAN